MKAFLLFFQERLLKETMETPVLHCTNLNSDTKIKADVFAKTSTSPEISKPVEPVIPLSSEKLSTPSFTKKQIVEEPVKAGKTKIDQKQTAKLENKGVVVNYLAESKNAGDLKDVGQVKKVGEVNQAQNHRPSNPFAKSSNNQDKSSLLDSLKKMKNDNKK